MSQTEYEAVLSKRCRIKAVMMVETDIIASHNVICCNRDNNVNKKMPAKVIFNRNTLGG
jgi:hypothetical protein